MFILLFCKKPILLFIYPNEKINRFNGLRILKMLRNREVSYNYLARCTDRIVIVPVITATGGLEHNHNNISSAEQIPKSKIVQLMSNNRNTAKK